MGAGWAFCFEGEREKVGLRLSAAAENCIWKAKFGGNET